MAGPEGIAWRNFTTQSGVKSLSKPRQRGGQGPCSARVRRRLRWCLLARTLVSFGSNASVLRVCKKSKCNARSVRGRGGSPRPLLLLFLALPVSARPRSGSYEPIGPPGGGSRRPFLNLDQVSVIPNSPRARGPERLVPVKGRTIYLLRLCNRGVCRVWYGVCMLRLTRTCEPKRDRKTTNTRTRTDPRRSKT